MAKSIQEQLVELSERMKKEDKREFRMIAIATIICLIVFAVALQKLFFNISLWLK